MLIAPINSPPVHAAPSFAIIIPYSTFTSGHAIAYMALTPNFVEHDRLFRAHAFRMSTLYMCVKNCLGSCMQKYRHKKVPARTTHGACRLNRPKSCPWSRLPWVRLWKNDKVLQSRHSFSVKPCPNNRMGTLTMKMEWYELLNAWRT